MSLLVPKRVKYRKTQRGSRKGNATRNAQVTFGAFGLQAIERAWMKNREIEAARVAINRALNKKGKMWIKVFPHKPVTARPPETRMGKGKGQPEFWVAVIRPGTVLFEVDGVTETIAREAFRLAANKLSFRCRFVARNRKVSI